MLLNIPSNQPRITTTVPIHCSLPSSYQGHDQDESNVEEEQVNEDNIDDNQQRRQGKNEQGEQDDGEDEEDAPSHTCDVGSTNVAVPSLTKKKLKHCSSSSTFHPTLIPRSSSTLTATSATVMLRHQHQHRHPRHDTYRTLQLPVNSANKLLIVAPNGQHRPTLTSTAGSENNLRSMGTHRHNDIYQQHPNGNSCFDEETVRTLSRGKSICLGPAQLTLNTYFQ